MHHRNTLDQGGFNWRKSSFSGGEDGNCVEVGGTPAGTVPVRDTKDRRQGPVLNFTPASWASFVRSVKNGGFGQR
jgi:hypothetical protein